MTDRAETSGELLARIGTDARLWADAFQVHHPHTRVDYMTLVTWFANAIEAGRSAGREQT